MFHDTIWGEYLDVLSPHLKDVWKDHSLALFPNARVCQYFNETWASYLDSVLYVGYKIRNNSSTHLDARRTEYNARKASATTALQCAVVTYCYPCLRIAACMEAMDRLLHTGKYCFGKI